MDKKKHAIIISNDSYFIQGLRHLLHDNYPLHVEYLNISEKNSDELVTALVKRYNPEETIIFIAVDDFKIIYLIPGFWNYRIVFSLRHFQQKTMLFSFCDVIFISRNMQLKLLLDTIDGIFHGVNPGNIALSTRENDVVFNYFRWPRKSYIQTFLNIDVKRVSYYKRSVYQKIMVTSDCAGYHVIRAMNDVSGALLMGRQENVNLFCRHSQFLTTE
ncbi:hypothetical protein PU088_000966 [Citrobacter farmeri]|uniref:LuxR family transcriptional regulator n=1 Tax=Citrobacter amalonaticus Y19 TaxID=1261127 RepID=A0A0F6TTR0_CITAM|nr:hypothetical protein [Citrobacter amalonaticus]AKE58407.1 hypothetical protein F384_04230 [Citrobacter amalonaticus Y19]EKV5653530.1 hypothetical protein [Citrobacter farmeri]